MQKLLNKLQWVQLMHMLPFLHTKLQKVYACCSRHKLPCLADSLHALLINNGECR